MKTTRQLIAERRTPLITVNDLRECLMGGQAVLAMFGHDITHFYEPANIGMSDAVRFFARENNRELDYVTDSMYLAMKGQKHDN